jgi:hypothetical protein
MRANCLCKLINFWLIGILVSALGLFCVNPLWTEFTPSDSALLLSDLPDPADGRDSPESPDSQQKLLSYTGFPIIENTSGIKSGLNLTDRPVPDYLFSFPSERSPPG